MRSDPLYNILCIICGLILAAGAARQHSVLRSMDRSRAFTVIGDSFESKGLASYAAAAYERGCSEPYYFPHACFNLGQMRISRTAPGAITRYSVEAAVDSLRKGLSVIPNDPSARLYLGTALAGLGRHSEALAEMRAAVRLAPRDVNVRSRLVDLLRRLGDEGSAQREEKLIEELKSNPGTGPSGH